MSLDEGMWTAKWQSIYEHVEPGCFAYPPNVIELYWGREDVLHGKNADREVASALFQTIACTVRVRSGDSRCATLQHELSCW